MLLLFTLLNEHKGNQERSISQLWIVACLCELVHSVRLNSTVLCEQHQQLRLAHRKTSETLIPLPLKKSLFCYIH